MMMKPQLFITLKDTAGKAVVNASVRLFKNKNLADTGIVSLSDTTGVVFFKELDTVLYHWTVTKGCANNRSSQTTLGRSLINNVILYGYSVIVENGTLIVTNNSTTHYLVNDSLSRVLMSTAIVAKDTPYIVYPFLGLHKIHSEKVGVAGTAKDTMITFRCGDTSRILLP